MKIVILKLQFVANFIVSSKLPNLFKKTKLKNIQSMINISEK